METTQKDPERCANGDEQPCADGYVICGECVRRKDEAEDARREALAAAYNRGIDEAKRRAEDGE